MQLKTKNEGPNIMRKEIKKSYEIYKIFFYALILLANSIIIFAAEKEISVATLTDYPPFTFDKQNSAKTIMEYIPPGSDSLRLQGYSWDILREVFHEMGYSLQLYVFPWKRAFYQVKNGTLDILFPTGYNEERAKFFHYSKETINHANFIIYVREDSKIEWNGLESLKGLTIGAGRGWNYGTEWESATYFQKYELNKIMQGFEMLHKKRLDGVAGYEINVDYAIKQANLKVKCKKLPPFGFSKEYAVGAKTNPRSIKILEDFDIGKRRIIKNGVFKKITEKWK